VRLVDIIWFGVKIIVQFIFRY